MLFLEGLVGLHRTVQLQLLQHYQSGHRWGLLSCCEYIYLIKHKKSSCSNIIIQSFQNQVILHWPLLIYYFSFRMSHIFLSCMPIDFQCNTDIVNITLWEISILIYTCVDCQHFYLRKPLTWLCSNCRFPGDSVVKNLPAMWKIGFNPLVRKFPPRRKWQPTPEFLLGKSRRQRSVAGYSPWGHKRAGHDLVTKQWQQFKQKNLFYCTLVVRGNSLTLLHSLLWVCLHMSGLGSARDE